MRSISLLLLFVCCLTYGQHEINLDSLNKYFEIEPIYFSEGIKRGTVNPTQLKNKKFEIEKLKQPLIGKEYWSSFYIIPIPELKFTILEFSFPLVDRIEVYVPLKSGGYAIFPLGMSVKTPNLYQLNQTSLFYVAAARLDFSKPFLVKNVPMSFFGLDSLTIQAQVAAYSSPPMEMSAATRQKIVSRTTFEYEYVLLLGMIMISFVFMFIHYVITKQIYFLFYSLYLFFLIFNYGYRTFYFYNIYSGIHENLYFYLNQNGQLLAFLCYMLFMKFFTDIRYNYPKLNGLYNATLWLFLGFIIIYNFTIISNPYYPYHEIIMKSAIYLLTSLSFGFIFYMFFKKRLLHTSVMFIGSLILLMGYVTAIISHQFFILVPLVVVETIFFISVIAYLDLRNFKKGIEADKLKEIDEFKSKFFTNISHEFLTPLTLINGPIEDQLLSDRLTAGERRNLGAALRNSQRLKKLVDQLLAWAELESGKLRLNVHTANMPKFISAHAAAFKFSCDEKQIKFTVGIEKDENQDWFDPDIVEKIIHNLLGNAINHTPENGVITLKGYRENEKFKISVINSGNYIPNDVQRNIFNRFYQADSRNPGTGIGLALTKELIEIHQGSISLKSEENGVTEFTVSLPISKNVFDPTQNFSENQIEEFPVSMAFSEIQITDRRNTIEKNVGIDEDVRVILIVDDNKDIREYVSSIFENSAIIYKACNGKEGFVLAIEKIPDIVISDVMMPEEDGFTLTKHIKEHQLTAHIPVILLTAKTQITSKLEAMGIGADAYLTKPFNSQLLKATVENLIENRRKLQQRFAQEVILMPKDIAVSSVDEYFLERLQQVLDVNLTESAFTVEQFSTKMGVSRMQLHRKLKALTGQATTEFLRSQRLKMACHLLKNNKIPISQIGYAVGFNDPSYFSRCFKQEFGCAPSEFLTK